jgi:hypothetical protein
MTIRAKTATVIEELVDYDGLQLLLLKTDRKRHMLATAIKREKMDEPFFCCEITDKVYDSYFDEKADLHFAFQRAIGKNYYFFDLARVTDKTVELEKATNDESEKAAYWPQVGFFSRSHTTHFNRSTVIGETKTFKIDGRWGTNDFSHFHGKMSDLYALFGVLHRIGGRHKATERGFIRKAIQDRFWRGGGSYLGFYDDLMERNRLLSLTPLEVAKIQYASPGVISLRGDRRVLSDINDIIEVFDEKWEQLGLTYKNIHSILRKEKLLRAKPTTHFSGPAIRNLVLDTSRKFAGDMRLERIDEIYDACDSNVLVFAKLVLSIYRRANELYMFHAEGRVQRAD